MTYPIPPSWQLKAGSLGDWLFSDWGTWLGEGDAPYWVEHVEKVSPSTITSHFASPSAAEMIFLTDYNSVIDQTVQSGLMLSILGGYDGTNMNPPFACPYNSDLYATDIEIKPAYLDNTNTNTNGTPANYRVGLCRVGFQSLPYEVNFATGENPYNPNFVEYRSNSANQQFTTPSNYYVFAADTSTTAALGTLYVTGLTYFEVILHRVPAAPTLSLASGSPSDYCGTINENAIFGADDGQLLLQSIDMGDGPFADYDGRLLANIHLHFLFNPQYWNTALDTDGSWKVIKTKVDGNPPLTSSDMVALMNLLLPAQA